MIARGLISRGARTGRVKYLLNPHFYMAPPRNRGIFGRLDELREQAVGIRDTMAAIEKENAELREVIKDIWNPKWGTRDPAQYDPEQLARGVKVEREHTDNDALALEITMDHLDEFEDYYIFLDMMETMMKQGIDPKNVDYW